MPIVHFTGKVLVPPPMQINIKNLPPVQYYEAPLKLTMIYKVSVVNSEVGVEVEIGHFDEDYLSPLYTRAMDFARVAIDTVSFVNGFGLTVYLDKAMRPDGNWTWMMPKDSSLKTLVTAINTDPSDTRDKNFDTTFRRFIQEPGLFMALNDLIMAITLPHYAPVNCARAIEGLRNLVIPGDGDRKQSWPVFRAALNVDQTYIEFITDLSKAPRHGDRTFVPDREVEETTKRSWILMNRFLEYRRRGSQPLPPSEFPLLT
jgi:hypothetical protein